MPEWKEPPLPQQVISGLAELLSSRGDVCQHLGNGTGGSAAPAQHCQSRTCPLQLGAANPSCSRVRMDDVGACGNLAMDDALGLTQLPRVRPRWCLPAVSPWIPGSVWTSLMLRSKSLCSSTGLETRGGRDAGTKHRPLLHSQHSPYLAVWTKDTHTHKSSKAVGVTCLVFLRGKTSRLLCWVIFCRH